MDAQAFYEKDYQVHGLDAQRRWPNEEFARFMGRNFFGRGPARILEMGCGTGANLRLVAEEGFDAWGVDFSAAAIEHCRAMLARKGFPATLSVARMEASGLPSGHFDAVADVFSAYCLDEHAHCQFLGEVERLLKPGGLIFSFTPSRTTAHLQRTVFAGNDYPWRFTTVREYSDDLSRRNFNISRAGVLRRPDGFEFVVIEGKRQ